MANHPHLSSYDLLNEARPWAFSRAELTAGLRRHTGDPSLTILELKEYDIPHQRPSIGQIRGLLAVCASGSGASEFPLVLKETRGTTRTGTAGAGLREVSVYLTLDDHLPVRLPQLLAAHPGGDWLVLQLLTGGRHPEHWRAADYLVATDQLVALHDRFWGLGSDLATYNWLARPLDLDFNIFLHAAATGLDNLSAHPNQNSLSQDQKLMALLQNLITHADKIIQHLRCTPSTLLHGNFFPGNIHMHADGTLTVYDWEETAIGPGILDLVTFIQASRWWFDPLPIAVSAITDHYRQRLQLANGFIWADDDWQRQYDHALLWIFITQWIDLLAAIPDSMLSSRLPQLNAIWLEPVYAAALRRLPEA